MKKESAEQMTGVEMMEYAMDLIRPRLGKRQEMDDVKWGDNCFEINIFHCGRTMEEYRLVASFSFYYREDDEDEIIRSTAKQKIEEWVDEKFYGWKKGR